MTSLLREGEGVDASGSRLVLRPRFLSHALGSPCPAGALPPFAARGPRLFGRELVSRALHVGGLAALAAGDPRLLGRELMRGALLVGRFAPFAGDRSLLLRVHRG